MTWYSGGDAFALVLRAGRFEASGTSSSEEDISVNSESSEYIARGRLEGFQARQGSGGKRPGTVVRVTEQEIAEMHVRTMLFVNDSHQIAISLST